MRRELWSRLGVLSVSLVTLLLAPGAHAETSAANKAAAEALFEQGRALAQESRFDEACAKFDASQQLDPGLGTLLHLADCYERAGKLASAWATFVEASSIAKSRGEEQRAKIADVRASALAPQLITVILEVPEELPAGFEVTRNGTPVPLAALGSPVPVDPGTWLIRASAPGYVAFETSVTVDGSSRGPHRLTIPMLTPEPVTEAPAAPAPRTSGSPPPRAADDPTEPSSESQRTLGLIIGSAGVIAAVVGGIFTVMATSNDSNSKDDCRANNPNLCGVDGVRDRDDAIGQANIATVATVIGVVGIGAGATLFFTAPEAGTEMPGAMVGVGGSW